MKTELIIELVHLPEEGIELEGELAPSVLATLPNDPAQADSPLYYSLRVQRFDNELLVQGYLEASLKMTCVRSNQEFLQTVEIENFSASVEIQSGRVDITEILREEIFIKVPNDPICDDEKEKTPCNINSDYLTVDKALENSVKQSPATDEKPHSGNKWGSSWEALDSLTDLSSNEETK